MENHILFYPYKIIIVKKILLHGPAKHLQFSKHILNILQDNLAVIIISDEAHFCVDDHVNKQNCQYWAKENLSVANLCIGKKLPCDIFVKGWENQLIFLKIIVERW